MKRYFIRISFAILIVSTVFTFSQAAGTYNGGSGDPNNPYLIADANDMQEIGANTGDWDKHFLLTKNIDLGRFRGTEFNIIGDWSSPFKGVFNGNGHSISNFSYNTSGGSGVELDGIGIFKHVKGDTGKPAEIKNLDLIDPNVISDGRSIGSLIGMIGQGPAIIDNCYSNKANVLGDERVGGLIGAINYDVNITILVSNCGATGEVKGNSRVGGLVGYLYLGKILQSWANCNVEGGNAVGGLIGSGLEGYVTKSWSSGTVVGNNWVGGLAGASTEFYITPIIQNCYSTSSVNGTSNVGGLIGSNTASVHNCFSVGKVIGVSSVGGFIGDGTPGSEGDGSYSIIKSFWDSSINPDLDGFGVSSDPNVLGKTTTEMKQKSTFTNWDFTEDWGIEDNQTYPFLRLTYPVGDINLSKDVNLADLCIIAYHWLEGTQ